MPFLSKNDIQKVDDLHKTLHREDVPEWDGSVMIRVLTGRERDEFESFLLKKQGKGVPTGSIADTKGIRSFLVSRVLCDEQGNRLFSSDDADVAMLESKNGAVLDRLFKKCLEVNALTERIVEEMAKN
jgi:hypothetical protein